MKKRIVAIALLAVLVLGLFAGCGKSGVVTEEQAQKIAMEAAGMTKDQVTDVHTHLTTVQGIPCYSVHITTADGDFSVLINAGTGEIVDEQ